MRPNFRLAMLGFGNAGQAFAKLLLSKLEQIETNYQVSVRVVAITTGSRGALSNPEGIDLARALEDLRSLGRFNPKNPDYSTLSSMEVVNAVDYDALAELTPLAIFSGQPAIDHIRGALLRKKHVITANKGPIAWAYESLRQLAEDQGVLFLHETTVMDGTPIFNLVRETLPLCEVKEVMGIVNSTTNYVLEELARGEPYEQVILEGQKRGFVEADPSLDIEGWDSAAKTAALLNVLMRANITPDQIQRKGIEDITFEKIKEAEARGKVYKLLSRGFFENGQVIGRVWPAEVDLTDLLASIKGTSSVLRIMTDLMGTVTVVEEDPEIEQTAYGVFSDLLHILNRNFR